MQKLKLVHRTKYRFKNAVTLISNKSINWMQQILKFVTWCLCTAQHASGVLTLPVKPEAATAVVELLMMGVRTPETCWPVDTSKRQVEKLLHLVGWFIWNKRRVCAELSNTQQIHMENWASHINLDTRLWWASRSGLLTPRRKNRARCSLYRTKVETSAGLDNFGKREISFPWRAAKADYSVVRPVEQSLYRANPFPTLRICIIQKHKTFYAGKVCQIPKEFLRLLLCITLGAFVSLRSAN
jgi:hypothetical protein